MKLQLTKTKTIDIDFSKLGGGGKSKQTDIVGVELFSQTPEGCPAVHLYRKKNAWHLGAAAYVPPPEGELPERWEDTPRQPTWSLPHAFQAPGAAIAVNSPDGVFGQSSPEAVVREMMTGVATDAAAPASAAPGSKRFGLKRSSPPPRAAEAKSAAPAKAVRRPEFPAAGMPVSENGRRFVVRPFAEDGFCLSASLPEFQSLWLGRLLPEGRRPTAVSIQLAEAALMASVLAQPEYVERGGNMLAALVRADAVFLAGYKNGLPVLWRRCPGNNGYAAMRKAVKKTLGVDDELVSSVLEESLIDPRPALEPFLHPLLDQLELARAYLSGKHGVNADRVLLCGLPAGASHWTKLAEEALKITLVPADPFDGIVVDKGVVVSNPCDYLVALGAALAASEVET